MRDGLNDPKEYLLRPLKYILTSKTQLQAFDALRIGGQDYESLISTDAEL